MMMRRMMSGLLLVAFAVALTSAADAGLFKRGCFKKKSRSNCCTPAPAPAPCCQPAAPTCESVTMGAAPVSYQNETVGSSAAPMVSSESYPMESGAVINSSEITYENVQPQSSGSMVMEAPVASQGNSTVSWSDALAAVRNFLARDPNMTICDISTKIPAYGSIIKGLNPDQKLTGDGGPVCFPSEAHWNSSAAVRAEMTEVLRSNGIL